VLRAVFVHFLVHWPRDTTSPAYNTGYSSHRPIEVPTCKRRMEASEVIFLPAQWSNR